MQRTQAGEWRITSTFRDDLIAKNEKSISYRELI
jgi:hypothetical protein